MNINKQYSEFISDILDRCSKIGLDLMEFPIDHVCYRAKDRQDYAKLFEEFKAISVMYTTKHFHGRRFHTFFLKEPFQACEISSYLIEFAEPGGSDAYETGFQHIEILSNQSLEDMLGDLEGGKELIFAGKFGDETYLKWPDKIAFKVKTKPLFFQAIAEDNSEKVVL